MSKVKFNIQHTPSFNEYRMTPGELQFQLTGKDFNLPFPLQDYWYYYTDLDGWLKILPDLIINSALYKPDRFDCDDYAMKAYITCRERYSLNTMAFVNGNTPAGRHGFNMFFVGDEFLLFEPNGGFEFSGQAFPINENGYIPDLVFI